MADVELKSPTTGVEHAAGAVSEAEAEGHTEHEDSNVQAGHESSAQDDLVEEAVRPDATPDENVQDAVNETEPQAQPEEKPTVQASSNEEAKSSSTAKRSAVPTKDSKSAKATPGKPTPLSPAVRRVASSGPAAKAAPSGKAATTTTSTLSKSTSATPPTAKKTTSPATANSPSKTANMSSRTSTSGPPPPSRRSSMLPPRAPSATGAPATPKSRTATLFSAITGSTSPKPSPPSADASASSRPSVVSPSGSIASLRSAAAAPPPRSRGSISEAPKRQSTTAPKPPPQNVVGPAARTMRTVGSISSIKEVQGDDNKVILDLQQKLEEANKSAREKTELVAQLEKQISGLQESLDAASADVKAQNSVVDELQQLKRASESELTALKASLHQLENERARDLSLLAALKDELEVTKQANDNQTARIEELQEKVTALTSEIMIAHENFESLRASSDQSSSEAAAAAQAERESFLRAKADLDALNTEIDALRVAHDTALKDAADKLNEAQQRTSEVASLMAQIEAFKGEREESANKVSELEVEVLELKESQESAEDKYNKLLSRLKQVEADLAEAKTATEQAIQNAKAIEQDGAQSIATLKGAHEEEMRLLRDELTEAVGEIENLKSDLAVAEAAHDETRKEAEAASEEHERQLEESEQSYLSKHIEFSEEIKRLSAELEGQEAKYNEKVEAVKAEHALLLQEAFERAKSEAAELHSQDLQALRVESQATIEQLRTAHQSFVSDLEAEHQTTLQSQINILEKQLSSQGLELRATQDDLSKAKATLEAARSESESLKVQLEEARAAVIAASANVDQAVEIERLTKQLVSMRDENTMLNDVLAATKESLSEMSANHGKELEEAAKVRVEEVTRLRTEHEREVSMLVAQKSELSLSLGDLENEITMLKARLAAAEATVPRSNGVVLPPTGVTKEELQKVHEAHNLKMHDLQAEHERVVRNLKVEMDTVQNRLEEVQSDLARKNMEIQYLEQEQEESQDSITRLKAEVEQYKATESST